MPFDKFLDLTNVWEQRRQAVEHSLRSITAEELNRIAKEHQSEFSDDPWREKFVQLVTEHPHGSFYHAVVQEGADILYCRDEDFGVWVVPGTAMGPLDERGKRLLKEVIANHLSARS